MTKKWLMYAVTGILCCGLIGFAVAKQTNASGKTALERAKAALSNPTVSANNTTGSDNITVTDLNAMLRKAEASKGVSFGAQAPEGWVSPEVAQQRAVAGKAPAVENVATTQQVLSNEEFRALTGSRMPAGYVQPMSLEQERDHLNGVISDLMGRGADYSAQKARYNEIVAQLNDRAPRRPLDQGGETCALAPVITALPYCDQGTTIGAVNDYADGPAPEVVYSYTPSATGAFIVSLCGNTSYDTRLLVYSGGCPGAGGTLVINNDDFCGLQSCVTIQGVANTLYYILVDGFSSGNTGAYTLKVEADAGQGCSQLATCPGAIGRCCYGQDLLTCTNNTETDCAGLGGVWNGSTTCELQPCPNCNVTCDPNDIVETVEADTCLNDVSDPNGGCNNTGGISYLDIACGDAVCGELFTYISCTNGGQYRDTDWIRFTTTTPSIISYSAVAQFAGLQMFILDGSCQFIVYGQYYAAACGEIGNITTVCLPPGDYVAWAGPGFFSGLPYGGAANSYRAWVECTPCELPFGRCCYNAGSACADLYESDCLALGGTLDVGLSCATDPCANTCVNFTLNAPGSHTANTLGAGDDCTFRVSEDYMVEVVIPNDGQWTFSLCGGSTWDTYLYLSTGCCSGLITQNDDFCGLQSEIQCWTLTAGTYYVDIEAFSNGSGGAFTLNVTECVPCVLDCQPTDIIEPDDFTGYCANGGVADPNGGNNNGLFQDIACGDWVCAQAFTCDATFTRDTDWFRFTITQTQDVTVTVESAFNNLLFGIIDLTGNFFYVNSTLTDCNAGQASVTYCLPAGTYAAFGSYSQFSGLAVPSTYRINVECTTATCSYGRCCYNGGSSCAVTTDLDCAALGGTFDIGLDCTSPCENLCATDCGPNDGLEGDESQYCGSTGTIDPNGGCNVDPVSYQDIACGDTVCGEAFTCDDIGYRDTDWYRFTVDIPANVTVSVKPEFTNMLFGIVDITDCFNAFFISFAQVTDCQTWSSVTANLLPGTYVAFAAPGVFSGQPYGGPSNTYRLAVNGLCSLEPCDPITDLSINVVTAGAPPVADHIKLFWTAPQTDDYKVWSTTNVQNDGNPDDGADVDWTLEATILGVPAGPATWDAPAGFFGLPLIGAPKIYVVTAVCTPFQAPTGRCCYAGGCQDVTEEDCLGLGGTWEQFLTCANNPCPLAGGETVNDAIVISALPYTAASSTCGMVNDYDETCPYSGSLSPDQVFSYTPAANEIVNLSLCLGTTNYDTKLYIYENTVTPGAPFACNDDLCSGPNYPSSWLSSLSGIALTGGNTYYFVVDGYGSGCGDYTIQVTN